MRRFRLSLHLCISGGSPLSVSLPTDFMKRRDLSFFILFILSSFVVSLAIYVGSYLYLVVPSPIMSSMGFVGDGPVTKKLPGYRQVGWNPPFAFYYPALKFDQWLFPKRWKL
jgi:hypothetical protein